MGTTFREELGKEIRPEFIPSEFSISLFTPYPLTIITEIIGGSYVGYQEYVPFAFDLDYLCRGCNEEEEKEDAVILLLKENGETVPVEATTEEGEVESVEAVVSDDNVNPTSAAIAVEETQEKEEDLSSIEDQGGSCGVNGSTD